VHIASLGDAGSYYSPLQLDPERVPMGMGSGFMWDKVVRRQLCGHNNVVLLLLIMYILLHFKYLTSPLNACS
jgi:hypothetical protein